MNTVQVNKVGEYIASVCSREVDFVGCIMVDKCDDVIPSDDSRGRLTFAVVNILPSTTRRGMGHYILLGYKGRDVYYFDSYGVPLHLYSSHLAKYKRDVEGRGCRIITLGKRLQSDSSLVCGLYTLWCAYTLVRRGVRGLRDTITKVFTRDYIRNDRKIVSLAYTAFGSHLPSCARTFCERKYMNKSSYTRCISYICRGRYN